MKIYKKFMLNYIYKIINIIYNIIYFIIDYILDLYLKIKDKISFFFNKEWTFFSFLSFTFKWLILWIPLKFFIFFIFLAIDFPIKLIIYLIETYCKNLNKSNIYLNFKYIIKYGPFFFEYVTLEKTFVKFIILLDMLIIFLFKRFIIFMLWFFIKCEKLYYILRKKKNKIRKYIYIKNKLKKIKQSLKIMYIFFKRAVKIQILKLKCKCFKIKHYFIPILFHYIKDKQIILRYLFVRYKKVFVFLIFLHFFCIITFLIFYVFF